MSLSSEYLRALAAQLAERTFSRWESDVQDVMDYEDELSQTAATAILALLADREAASSAEPVAWRWRKHMGDWNLTSFEPSPIHPLEIDVEPLFAPPPPVEPEP